MRAINSALVINRNNVKVLNNSNYSFNGVNVFMNHHNKLVSLYCLHTNNASYIYNNIIYIR